MAEGEAVTASLVVLHGNSGGGKTSTARLLQRELGYGAMVVSQDVVRRLLADFHSNTQAKC